jgi:CRP-like cAMP-binding protein
MGNKLLAGLGREDFVLIAGHLSVSKLPQGSVLLESGEEADEVFFPLSGMVSLVVVMKDGKAIETATVGREGVIAGMAGLGLHISQVRAIAQLPLEVARISAVHLRKTTAGNAALTDLCLRFNDVLLAQARITAACNALHPVEARFCRWLLQTRDRAESDTVPLTQEFLSEMLGVRRTSVTEVASKLQAAGLIHYTRGIIQIDDIEGLQAKACECYDTLREQAPAALPTRALSSPEPLKLRPVG